MNTNQNHTAPGLIEINGLEFIRDAANKWVAPHPQGTITLKASRTTGIHWAAFTCRGALIDKGTTRSARAAVEDALDALRG